MVKVSSHKRFFWEMRTNEKIGFARKNRFLSKLIKLLTKKRKVAKFHIITEVHPSILRRRAIFRAKNFAVVESDLK